MTARRYVALAAAAVLVAVGAPALAGNDAALVAAPSVGTAASGVELFNLSLGGHRVSVGGLTLLSDTAGGAPVAKVVVTPVTVDGTSYAEQTVTPASTPLMVPSVDSATFAPATLSRLAAARSPMISASSSTANGASSRASTVSLGSLSVLGIPVALDGNVSVSAVVDPAGAAGEKLLTIRNVALPSIADLLAALGLDLSKLPPATLTTLTEKLGLVTTTITTATQALEQALAPLQPQLDAANQVVADAAAAVTSTRTTLTEQTATLDAASTTLVDATQTLQAALPTAPALRRAALLGVDTPLDPTVAVIDPIVVPTLSPAPLPTLPTVEPTPLPTLTASPLPTAIDVPLPLVTDVPAVALPSASALAVPTLPAVLPTDTQPLVDAYNTAKATYDAAAAVVSATTAQLNTLITQLNAASSLVNALLATVQTQVDALVAAVTAALDATPLVSLDSVTVRTASVVRTATTGGQTAEVVGGEISGLRVAGTDVLANALGTSSVNLLDLTGTPLAALTSAINGVTGTLSSVLSTVPSLPTLSVPAPTIGLLTKSTSTDVSGGFGRATSSLQALSITLPSITLPAAVALPNAASLPAYATLPAVGPALVRAQAIGDLVSTPITLALGTLTDTVSFRPAVAAIVAAPAAGGGVAGAPGTAAAPGSTPEAGAPGAGTPGGSIPDAATPGVNPPSVNATELPRTGASAALPGLALLLVAGAFFLRRRRALAA